MIKSLVLILALVVFQSTSLPLKEAPKELSLFARLNKKPPSGSEKPEREGKYRILDTLLT